VKEESGARPLPTYLVRTGELAGDAVFVADASFPAEKHPLLLTASGAWCTTEIEAVGAAVDLHSGEQGRDRNPTPSTRWRGLIAGLKGTTGGSQHPGFL